MRNAQLIFSGVFLLLVASAATLHSISWNCPG
jgi:hypothetical protein